MNLKGLLISFLLIGIVANATAQQPDLNQKMPVDPTVKIGKLSNGLTYYLKQNPKPEKRLLLQLAINAGISPFYETHVFQRDQILEKE